MKTQKIECGLSRVGLSRLLTAILQSTHITIQDHHMYGLNHLSTFAN